ncbi:MAG TPA: chemotaxis response regulator protein-glutamate methylesterase [Bryobacteraceae bacterium]|jgi:two-component system chemotaxis response regulator CheB|nr:chemotaxis response regulator protein-glutamate methylesterase [Bryobacteraceae bacterium]
MTTRVLVVDDTSLFRRVIADALAGIPDVEVVGSASNGKLALARIAALRPDLITLDIEMPEMNGIEVLEAMRVSGQKATVVMLSSLTVKGGQMTIRALEAGAFDFITKPEGKSQDESLLQLRDSLRPIIQTLARQREIRSILKSRATQAGALSAGAPLVPDAALARTPGRKGAPIVLIGVSTGGPAALAELLPAWPEKIGAPIFIVQHMPALFTEALAQRLQTRSAIRVKEAQNGEVAEADCAYLAPGGRQMKLGPGPKGAISITITDDPPENACRPSVDYLFRSVALNFPGRSIAAILTGMGNDGTAGIRMLKRGGCFSIAQDEASCVVFGMPREAIQAGVIDTIVPLQQIAGTIVRAIAEVGR